MDIREQLFSKPLPSNRTAYKKAIKAAKEIAGMFCMSDKMLLTISYIFEQMQEVTPLALQKILYFIQGIYMVMFDKPLYKEVYDLFKDFKFNPIEDNVYKMPIFNSLWWRLIWKKKKI